MLKVTDELIREGENGNGGWNRAQLALIGVDWPPKAGLRAACIGKNISEADAKKFVELRGMKQTVMRKVGRESSGQQTLGFD